MNEVLPRLGITREQARNNLRKASPGMSEEDIDAMIDVVETHDTEAIVNLNQNMARLQWPYARPYCANCKIVWGKQLIGRMDKCNKCGQETELKSFSPWPKIFIGLGVISLGAFTLILKLPLVWIGGFLWGGQLVFGGFNQWNKVQKLDKGIH